MIATQAKTSVWTIDSGHSFVEFSIRHLVFSSVRGRFLDVRGTITKDEAHPEHDQVEVEIEAASLLTSHEQRDADLRSAMFFDVENHPLITFRSTRVTPRGADLRIEGELTIKGITHPVVLQAHFNGQARNPWGQEVASYSATTAFDRTRFGLTTNIPLDGGGMVVGDEVRITIELELIANA